MNHARRQCISASLPPGCTACRTRVRAIGSWPQWNSPTHRPRRTILRRIPRRTNGSRPQGHPPATPSLREPPGHRLQQDPREPTPRRALARHRFDLRPTALGWARRPFLPTTTPSSAGRSATLNVTRHSLISPYSTLQKQPTGWSPSSPAERDAPPRGEGRQRLGRSAFRSAGRGSHAPRTHAGPTPWMPAAVVKSRLVGAETGRGRAASGRNASRMRYR